jgi:hypothetical protein
MSTSKHHLKIIDAIDISPSVFVHHRPSIHARGCRMAVVQVADDAMMGRGK